MESTVTPERREAAKKFLYRRGLIVLIALIVLEVFDYFMAQWTNGSATILMVLALINAALIVQYYMHIHTLFSMEGEH
ncbi:MAG TPA: hypothetical protein ENK60_06420 [Anaerolineae bacterium]|nr:hypothetical protein [Anaerolineae bacterium]